MLSTPKEMKTALGYDLLSPNKRTMFLEFMHDLNADYREEGKDYDKVSVMENARGIQVHIDNETYTTWRNVG